MDLFDTTQTALETAMRGQALREQALAENLANANTPGYQRVDVDFHGALAQAMGTSKPKHSLETTGFSPEVDATGATRADGSSVDVDAESAKLAANGLEHQTAVTVASARLSILRSAMGVA